MVRVAVLSALLLLACDGKEPPRPEVGAPDRGPPGEGLPPRSDVTHRLIDFVVQGCQELTVDRCTGPVPLKLTFSAVLQGDAQSLSWDFGDGAPAETGLVVSHTYVGQGSFTVTLGAVIASGAVVAQKPGFVQVKAAAPGGACSSDKACATGTCVCYQSCPFPLSEGLCLQPCEELACHLASTTCVDLTVPGLASPPAWRARLCLPICATDKECRPGFLCRLAPCTGGWEKACLPPFPREVGEPCRAPSGAVDPSLCLGGVCLDIGASGYCSAACGANGCPEGTRCARLGQVGEALCLRRCDPAPCAGDPRLACELPDPSGQYGFEILGPPDAPGTRYCAPKRCTQDGECGVAGRCDVAKGGFCAGR